MHVFGRYSLFFRVLASFPNCFGPERALCMCESHVKSLSREGIEKTYDWYKELIMEKIVRDETQGVRSIVDINKICGGGAYINNY